MRRFEKKPRFFYKIFEIMIFVGKFDLTIKPNSSPIKIHFYTNQYYNCLQKKLL